MSFELIAAERANQGTGASRRLRNAGRIPAIVYGGEAEPIAIDLDHNEIYHKLSQVEFHQSELTVVVGKKKHKVRLKAVQWHPYKQQVLHLDFQRV